MREEEIKQLEIDKIHWRDLYWEECEKNKKLNKQIEQFKKGVKAGTNIIERLEQENTKLKENIAWYEKEEDRLREENKKLKEKLEKWEKDYKEGIIVHCRNG